METSLGEPMSVKAGHGHAELAVARLSGVHVLVRLTLRSRAQLLLVTHLAVVPALHVFTLRRPPLHIYSSRCTFIRPPVAEPCRDDRAIG